MEARFGAGIRLEELLDPEGKAWARTHADRIKLIGAPAGMQPTAAIRNAWAGKPIGAVEAVKVTALHNGETLAFRLEWDDATENTALGDTTSFPDGAAILLPSSPGAPAITMGAPGAAVNAWYWRADENGKGRHLVAEGLGTTRTLDAELVRGQGVWKGGRWRVVIARALRVQSQEPIAQLEPGAATGFGIAVWEGDHGERAGIKSFSGDWRELRLAPRSTAGR